MEDVFDALQGPGTTGDIEAALQQAEALCGAHLPTGGGDVGDRPATPFTLGETALALRLTVHEKEMEVRELRQQYMQLADHSERMQQSLEEGLRERDSRTSKLEALLGSRDAALAQLTEQLQAYQGLSPDAAAAVQVENAALAAAKCAAEAAAAEAAQRAEDAGRRVHEGVATWERLQADLQAENGRLAAALQRQQHELAALFQEKEVLRARTAMLEARTAAAPGLLPPQGPASPRESRQAAADAASQLAAHQAAEAVQLRQRVEEREATARKYREAVRTLKRKVAELETQLQARRADKMSVAAARSEAAEAAALLTQCQQQLTEAKAEARQHVQHWEQRAKVAEQRAHAAGESLAASSAAAVRLAERSRGQAEVQAKAAALKALQLERRLNQLQQQHTAEAAQVEALRAQLAAVQQQQAAAEQSLQGQLRAKAAALAASEKKLRHLEAVLRRVADKADRPGGGGAALLIPAAW